MNTLKTNNEVEKCYTVPEIAKLLHLHQVTVRRFIREKKLPAVKMGKTWRIPHSLLAKFYREYLKVPM